MNVRLEYASLYRKAEQEERFSPGFTH